MGRPSKLTPAQWAEVERRILAGEGVRDLAKEFDVSPGLISQKRFSKHAKQVQEAAQKLAEGQMAVAALPVQHQYTAMTMADEIRELNTDVLTAVRISAKSGLRLHSMANSELQKVDDADPMADANRLKGVSVLTKMGNESMAPALNLLAANKERIQKMEEPEDDPDKPRGVLVVPGLIATPEAWSQVAQGKSGDAP